MAAVRGKNFTSDELKQLCLSYMEISEDPSVGNGQKKEYFWDRVFEHYESFRPSHCEIRSTKSLESKWGDVRLDVSKFTSCYQSVESLDISGTNSEDTLEKARELYKTRQKKNKPFTFIECWNVLKDFPRWMKPPDSLKKSGNGKNSTSDSIPSESAAAVPEGSKDMENEGANGDVPDLVVDVNDVDDSSGTGCNVVGKRPMGNKAAKLMAKKAKTSEDSMRVSAQAQKLMAENGKERLVILEKQQAILEKQQLILEKQQIINMFSSGMDHLDVEERELFKAWRASEMGMIRKKLASQECATANASTVRPLATEVTPPMTATKSAMPIPGEDVEEECQDVGEDELPTWMKA